MDRYTFKQGIFVPPVCSAHREEEFDSHGFELLWRMQREHFWYQGRHKFLLHALRRFTATGRNHRLGHAVDLGGGCGGWIEYLRRARVEFDELALADSSEDALRLAVAHAPGTPLYKIDLMNLQWVERWDIAFLLDVLEHIPDHETAMREIAAALKPGALLFVTVPAFKAFWTWNDELAGHQRRYRKGDFDQLARTAGLHLLDTRYFMFFLSPLLLASRLGVRASRLDANARMRLQIKMHEVPAAPINRLLEAVFAAETPSGHVVKFPWGTSALAVLQKPGIAR